MIYNFLTVALLSFGVVSAAPSYSVSIVTRSSSPVLSFVGNTSTYQQIFNPTWVQATSGTNGKAGIIARTQDCDSSPQVITSSTQCTWCGGAQDKASIMTFSQLNVDGSFTRVTENSVVFGPSDSSDSWGTEDPRIQYNSVDKKYYMFYTAYNGSAIQLSLATTLNPTVAEGWTKHGALFPEQPTSKSAALLLRSSPPHYLLWGDHEIRIAKSDDPMVWPNIGNPLIQIRADHFDSQLVESGPPPMMLENGNYLFFYNSAMLNWPTDLKTSYNVGWVILDGADPTTIIARSEVPLMSPVEAWEEGAAPYACNAPNVVFLEAAYPLGGDLFQVYFGGADSTIGSAVIQVKY
jgi:predicted GH43/DUF377 family glycosyl hydrolase